MSQKSGLSSSEEKYVDAIEARSTVVLSSGLPAIKARQKIAIA